ncbi:MAG: AAA family ATPase [Elusimicrobia bacterium]|nr:AAA family ATPase [Elusimicrobiota bacterium]MBD3411664.1 AAA family ATPase [Elusimicrobiota bacterium]
MTNNRMHPAIRNHSFSEIIVVEASAGSGKTYALAKRYISLLLNPRYHQTDGDPASILAITFTNKAAVEMKERIIVLLKRIALDQFVSSAQKKDIYSSIQTPKEIAQAKALTVLQRIIHNYNFFQVQTIDSFMNAVLLGSAFLIGRSAHFSIKTNYREAIDYSFDRTLNYACGDPKTETLLTDLVTQYVFIENRSGWLPKPAIITMLEFLIGLINTYGKSLYQYPISGKMMMQKKKMLGEQLKQFTDHYFRYCTPRSVSSLKRFVQHTPQWIDLRDIPSYCAQSQPPMAKHMTPPEDFFNAWQDIHTQLTEFIEIASTTVYNPYIKLAEKVMAQVSVHAQEIDAMYLDELNRHTRALYAHHRIHASEVYYRLATRFRHYLLDEFQDTSLLQWQNLEPLIEEALASGGSLFYVGDKKQSIYRFRGGTSHLFDTIKNNFSRFNPRTDHISENRRSQKAIVDFNNIIFSKDNLYRTLHTDPLHKILHEKSINNIIDNFGEAHQSFITTHDRGYVRVERVLDDDHERRNTLIKDKLFKALAELEDRFSYKDIAILARDNRDVQLVTSWLLAAGIPVTSEKTLNILNYPIIQEIISFLKFIQSPLDDISFTTFITGSIFTSATGIQKQTMHDFIFSVHAEKKVSLSPLYTKFRDRYAREWDQYISPHFSHAGFISSYETLVNIFISFSIMDRFTEYQALFLKLFDVIMTKEEDCKNLNDLLSYFDKPVEEELFVRAHHHNAISVLTIHKSKGLEFPVVIIPFFRISVSPGHGPPSMKTHMMFRTDGTMNLVRLTKKNRAFSENLSTLYEHDYAAACIDEFNELYVACTRPRFELYLVIPKKSGTSHNAALHLIPETITQVGSPHHYSISNASEHGPLCTISVGVLKNWIDVIHTELSTDTVYRSQHERITGTIIHALLAEIGRAIPTNLADTISRAEQNIRPLFPQVNDFFPFTAAVTALLEKPEIQTIVFTETGTALNEKEIINAEGITKRVDRVVFEGKDIRIIDYKLSRSEPAQHQTQVYEYMNLFSLIYPRLHCTGYIIYIQEQSIDQLDQRYEQTN